MIGIVIATHVELGKALIEAAEFIIGEPAQHVMAVSINLNDNVDNLRGKLSDTIKKVNSGDGVLLLTDMFGGSPSNLSYSMLEEGKIEVISGVNLPVLLKALSLRQKKPLAEMAVTLEAHGKKSISLASGILKGNKRSA